MLFHYSRFKRISSQCAWPTFRMNIGTVARFWIPKPVLHQSTLSFAHWEHSIPRISWIHDMDPMQPPLLIAFSEGHSKTLQRPIFFLEREWRSFDGVRALHDHGCPVLGEQSVKKNRHAVVREEIGAEMTSVFIKPTCSTSVCMGSDMSIEVASWRRRSFSENQDHSRFPFIRL
jgi:hypothetical protein